MTDWLTNWLTDLLTDLLACDRLPDWLIDWRTEWLLDWPTDTGRQINRLRDSMSVRSTSSSPKICDFLQMARSTYSLKCQIQSCGKVDWTFSRRRPRCPGSLYSAIYFWTLHKVWLHSHRPRPRWSQWKQRRTLPRFGNDGQTQTAASLGSSAFSKAVAS